MRETVELDPFGFPRILHAVLRHNDTPEEVTRASAVLKWVTENRNVVSDVLLPAQIRLLGPIQRHFSEHKQPTNRIYAEEIARKEDKPDGLVALLEEYDDAVPHLQMTSAQDMPQLVADRIADWERVKLLSTLFEAQQITVGALAPKKPTDPHLKGARDAIAYLSDTMYKDVMVTDTRTTGGSVNEKIFTIMSDYEENKYDRKTDRLQIMTGISCLDLSLRGFRKPEFVGVLGYAGNFKTTLCRTFLYNAAMQGYNCLHIPLESTYEEELSMYGIMHAHADHLKRFAPPDLAGINRTNFEDGTMSKAQEDFLRDVAIPDFMSNTKGSVLIRKPAVSRWAEVQQMIELADGDKPLHMVLIDYLALMDVNDPRNTTQAINETIKRVKDMCLTFKGGKGLIIITPVQGKREGYESAKANGGQWSSDGAYMYSEFEKSVDKMIYIYTDDELKSTENAKVGSCKSRRTKDVAPTIVERHVHSGRIGACALNGQNKEAPRQPGAVLEEGWV